ncbi:MAG: phage holin family protein [Anaerolineae bacterium]|nr:phage holin family protein [Anaerolineae bacterium]
MRNLLLRLIVNAAALAATAALLPGIGVRDNEIGTLLVVAFVFGLVNAVLKPIFIILSCPLIILTLGLFAIVVNGLMLLITDALAGGRFTVDGLGWAILGGLVVGAISGILERVLGLDEEVHRNIKRERLMTIVVKPEDSDPSAKPSPKRKERR